MSEKKQKSMAIIIKRKKIINAKSKGDDNDG